MAGVSIARFLLFSTIQRANFAQKKWSVRFRLLPPLLWKREFMFGSNMTLFGGYAQPLVFSNISPLHTRIEWHGSNANIEKFGIRFYTFPDVKNNEKLKIDNELNKKWFQTAPTTSKLLLQLFRGIQKSHVEVTSSSQALTFRSQAGPESLCWESSKSQVKSYKNLIIYPSFQIKCKWLYMMLRWCYAYLKLKMAVC